MPPINNNYNYTPNPNPNPNPNPRIIAVDVSWSWQAYQIYLYLTLLYLINKYKIILGKFRSIHYMSKEMMGLRNRKLRSTLLTFDRRVWSYHYGVIAQLVERLLSMQEALGSTPSNSIFFIHATLNFYAKFKALLILMCTLLICSSTKIFYHQHFVRS